MDFQSEAINAALKHGIDPQVFTRLIGAESNWNPGAVSSKGATGLGQLMPGTAREMGVTDPADPLQNLHGAAGYFRKMLDRHGGDYRLAAAAYNAGPGRVARAGGVPDIPETRAYVDRVVGQSNPFAGIAAEMGLVGANQQGDDPALKPPENPFAAIAVGMGLAQPVGMSGIGPNSAQAASKPGASTQTPTDMLRAASAAQRTAGMTHTRSYDSGVAGTPLDPTRDMTPGELFAAGMGKEFSDLALGVKQRVGAAPWEAATEKRQLDEPLMKRGWAQAGRVVGGAVAPIAATVAAPWLGTSAIGAGLLGAVDALAHPAEGPKELALNAGLSAAGGVLAKKAGDLVSGIIRPPIDVRQRPDTSVLARGEALGMRTTPGGATGSKTLKGYDVMLESHPATAGALNAAETDSQIALAKAAQRAIGLSEADVSAGLKAFSKDTTTTGNLVTSDTLRLARDRLSGIFGAVADGTPAKIDQGRVGSAFLRVLQDYRNVLTPDELNDVLSRPAAAAFQDAMSAGTATRDQLHQWQSQLGKAAMAAMRRNPQQGMALYDVQDAILTELQHSLNPAEQLKYAAARSQYRNLMNLTGNVGALNEEKGIINPATLANMLRTRDKGGYLYDEITRAAGPKSAAALREMTDLSTPNAARQATADLYDAVRFANATGTGVGNSGTAVRSANPLTNLALQASGAGPAVSAAYMSPVLQWYLRNGLLGGLSPTAARIVQQTTQGAGTGAAVEAAPLFFGTPLERK